MTFSLSASLFLLSCACLQLWGLPSPRASPSSLLASSPPHRLIYQADDERSSESVLISTHVAQSSSQSFLGTPLAHGRPSDVDHRILAAAPILGFYDDSNGSLSDWMASVSDETPLVSLNIPGTHDSATWNYTQATQSALEPFTGPLPPAIAYQCQSRSLFQMLADGIRFFDLRVGFLPGHQELGFYHAAALLSTTATLSDLLLGLYRWLDDHHTETILISIKVDNGTYDEPPSKKQPSSVALQQRIHDLLMQDDNAKSHWFQKDSELGHLGEVRGKLVFFQRFEWDLIRSDPSMQPLGIPLPPSQFRDNDASFQIIYNKQTNASANIEDFYNIVPNPTPFEDKVHRKLEAVDRNLAKAARSGTASNQLYITFASGGALKNQPPVTPYMLAVGQNTTTGVNEHLNELLDTKFSQQRLGVVILDWYYQTPDIIQKLINYNIQA